MSGLTVAVVGDERDAAMTVTPGSYEWGTLAYGTAADDISSASAVVVLGDAACPETLAPRARWWPSPVDGPRDEAILAPGGEGLWSCAPWPVADHIFDLDDPVPMTPALVVGGSQDERNVVVDKLTEKGVAVAAAPRLTVEGLQAASVVGILGESGQPLVQGAFAALAARRLLVIPPASPRFGLESGVDHFTHANPDELVHAIDMLFSHPYAWAPISALGRQVAESQRASVIFGRVARRLADGW